MQAKFKLNSTEVWICKAWLDLNISHGKSVLMNNILKEYDDMKEEIESLNVYTVHLRLYLFIKQFYCILWCVEKIQKVKMQKL